MSDRLVDQPATGRTYSEARTVSIDDATATGRMEFDAIARFLQDVGNADTDDAGFPRLGLAWVARRAVIDVHQFPVSRERIELTTWCSGTGSRWAERRTTMHGAAGGHVEAATIWIHLDPDTGRPTPWGDEFAATYLEATQGREVSSRLQHPKKAPAPGDPGVHSMPFTFRRTDMDAFQHVNNAAYLAILEEALGDGVPPAPVRVEVEWRTPSVAGEELTVVETFGPDGVQLWVTADGGVRTTIAGRPMQATTD